MGHKDVWGNKQKIRLVSGTATSCSIPQLVLLLGLSPQNEFEDDLLGDGEPWRELRGSKVLHASSNTYNLPPCSWWARRMRGQCSPQWRARCLAGRSDPPGLLWSVWGGDRRVSDTHTHTHTRVTILSRCFKGWTCAFMKAPENVWLGTSRTFLQPSSSNTWCLKCIW